MNAAAKKTLEAGTKVQGLFRTPEGKVELYTGTVLFRDSVSWYMIGLDDGTKAMDSRSNFTPLPAVDPLSPQERAVVSRLKVERKLEALRQCPERECRAGYSCEAHKEL